MFTQKRIHSAQPTRTARNERDRMQKTMTKEQLRGLKAKIEEEARIMRRNHDIKRLSDTIWENVIQTASFGRCVSIDDMAYYSKEPPTRYFYNSMPGRTSHLCGRNVSDISDDVIEKLRETFPDCLIEYRETKAMDGRVIESGILVDWS